jgi:hypothetical protein
MDTDIGRMTAGQDLLFTNKSWQRGYKWRLAKIEVI